jgi:phosphoserine aminotransferase
MKEFPKVDTLMVCDMSSDIFSRVIDFTQFDLIYAGAQKNMGPAGTTLVVVKKEILGKTGRDIPSYLDYSLQIAKESMFNTPPVFPIYASLLTLQHLENNGGIEAAEKRNIDKAALLYAEIDRNPLFETFCEKEDRSLMNVSFKLLDDSKKEEFDAAWKNAGINGLNGHRSLGGYRASMYNALPIESVQVLVDVMKNLN